MPFTAPRNIDEIITSVLQTVEEVNPSIDLRKGPLAVLMWAFAQQLAQTETFVSYLLSVYQLENADLIEEPDLVSLGENYGKDPNVGRASQILVYLYRYSRPEAGQTYEADVGSAVGTDDSRFVFTLLNNAEMNGNYADIYYNPDDQWYEIPVLVEAVAVGADYDLPPKTITKILSSLEDFDGVVNKDHVRRQGSDPADPIQFVRQLQENLQGINQDVLGHVLSTMQDLDPTGFDDVALIPSVDYDRFKRTGYVQSKMGCDVYVISDLTIEYIQEGVAQGGETEILLERGPSVSVAYVSVNGLPVPFSYSQDTTPAFYLSPLASDKVILSSPLLPLQNYQISLVYYDFVYNAWQAFQGRNSLFQTDMLVRLGVPVEVYIAGEAIVAAASNREDVLADLQIFTQQYFRNPEITEVSYRRFITQLDPSDYANSAEANVDGLNRLKISNFIRLDRAFLDVETITFDGTEYPILSINFDIV